ncbi:MAG: error-prone DNA polymerase, partial [Acidimicrobiia bacterium]|nr:error-prone DNA polymerase [Acidimicrobiia bacterium]
TPSDLALRTGLGVDALEGLAASGALESIGLGRREGMWAAGALAEVGPGRLPLSPGADPPKLPGMNEQQEHLADLWAVSASTSHPIQFIRDRLSQTGCITAAELLSLQRTKKGVRVGGVVTHRQRPGTANGVRFFNLEDETGLVNVVILPPVWEANYEVARKAPALVVEGLVEYRDGVTNLVAHRFEPLPTVESVKSRDFR